MASHDSLGVAVLSDDTQKIGSLHASVAKRVRLPNKRSLLHAACEAGAVGCVQLLAHHSSLLNCHTRDGYTPLLTCCLHLHAAHCESLCILIKAGANLDARRKEDGAGAAHLCAAHGCSTCLQRLLDRAPQLVDARDRQQRQPLHAAAACVSSGGCACVTLLLAAGALSDEPMSCRDRPLHIACRGGHTSAAILLLQKRSNPNARNFARRTALHEASAAQQHTLAQGRD